MSYLAFLHRSKLHLSIQLVGDIGRNIGQPEQDTRRHFQFRLFGFLLVLSLLAFPLLRYGAIGFLSEVDVDHWSHAMRLRVERTRIREILDIAKGFHAERKAGI